MEYSGAGGKLIYEKNQKQKSRDTVPLSYEVRERYQTDAGMPMPDWDSWLYRKRYRCRNNFFLAFGIVSLLHSSFLLKEAASAKRR